MATPRQILIGELVSFDGENYRIMEYYFPGKHLARKFVIENLRTGYRKCVFKHQLDFNDSDDDMLLSVLESEMVSSIDLDLPEPGEPFRFASASDKRLEDLAKSRNEKSTEISTKWAIKIFRDWLQCNNLPVEFEMTPVDEFNSILRKFYAEIRTKTGKEYSKSAMTSIRAAINRHITSPPYERHINIMHDREFMTSNHVFTGIVKEMKRAGKDVTRHHDAISPGDFQKMYSTGTLSNQTPVTLIRKVWFEVTLHFGRRGVEGLRGLRNDSFVIAQDDTGAEYFRMAYNESDKTHHGVDSRENEKQPRMYQSNDDNCPVKSLKLYLAKRNQTNNAFFQRPLSNPKPGNCWYSAQPMGENTLKKMMSNISHTAELSQTYTNHCVRATAATKLSEAGVGPLGIMSVTGHRNEQSLKSYITTPSVAQRRVFSNILHSNDTTAVALPPLSLSHDHATSRQVDSTSPLVSSSQLPSAVSYSSTNSVNTPFHGLQLLHSANISGGNISFNFYDGKHFSSD